MRLNKDLLTPAGVDVRRPLQRAPIELTPLLTEAGGQFKLLAPQRTLTCRVSPEATMRGDRAALKQILLILLDNARKHTLATAVITLTTAVTASQITLSVADDGSGIVPDSLSHIFDRFFRGDAARSGPGTGLGLARELASAMGGILTVASRATGRSLQRLSLKIRGGKSPILWTPGKAPLGPIPPPMIRAALRQCPHTNVLIDWLKGGATENKHSPYQ